MLTSALTLGVLFCAPASISCSASQQGAQTVLSGVVTVTVDLCDAAQNLTPPPGSNLIGLVCRIAGAVEQTLQIFIDQDVWAGMQTSYLAMHGSLPTGMTQIRARGLQPNGTGLPGSTAQDAGPSAMQAAPPDSGPPAKDAEPQAKSAAPPKKANPPKAHPRELPME